MHELHLKIEHYKIFDSITPDQLTTIIQNNSESHHIISLKRDLKKMEARTQTSLKNLLKDIQTTRDLLKPIFERFTKKEKNQE